MTRVEMARAGSTDEGLLAAPLPSELGEGNHSARAPVVAAKPTPPPPSASPISLADLARSVASEPQPSDAKDFARESLSIAARSRTSSPSLSDIVRPDADRISVPAPTSAPPPVSTLPAPASAPAPVQLVAAPAPERPKRSMMGPVLAAGVALIGMAAAAVIVVRHQKGAEAPVAAATVAAPDLGRAPTPAPAAVDEPKPDLEITSPEALGAADQAPAARGGALAMAPKTAPGKVAPEAKATEPAKPAPVASAPAETDKGKNDDKEAAKMKPAAQPTNVPQEPSLGAAQAAIGQVLGSARACVAGHEAASRATVVFGSDGRVQGVSVSGPAAGTPAEACIRAAMSRARVEPFAKPTFSVGTPIRP
jgi:hypothetical protein